MEFTDDGLLWVAPKYGRVPVLAPRISLIRESPEARALSSADSCCIMICLVRAPMMPLYFLSSFSVSSSIAKTMATERASSPNASVRNTWNVNITICSVKKAPSGPCIHTAIWLCRDLLSQWQHNFKWKLSSHWLKVLRHRQIVSNKGRWSFQWLWMSYWCHTTNRRSQRPSQYQIRRFLLRSHNPRN